MLRGNTSLKSTRYHGLDVRGDFTERTHLTDTIKVILTPSTVAIYDIVACGQVFSIKGS